MATNTIPPDDAQNALIAQLLADGRCPFGPRFFLTQLAAFLRERCPDPGELPRVDLWIEGEPRPLCHVITVAPRWMAIAVWNGRGHDATMVTEIVPYELISRVTIGAGSRAHGIGFHQVRPPAIVAIEHPDQILDRLARPAIEAHERGAGANVSSTAGTFPSTGEGEPA